MISRIVPSAALALLIVIETGCDTENGSGGGAGSGASSGASELIGAWYGSGAGFPDGQLCFILCENFRFFAGDRPCADTSAGDFAGGFSTYMVSGSMVTFTSMEDGPTAFTATVTGDVATFTIEGYPPLQLDRTASSSPLCTDDTIPPR